MASGGQKQRRERRGQQCSASEFPWKVDASHSRATPVVLAPEPLRGGWPAGTGIDVTSQIIAGIRRRRRVGAQLRHARALDALARGDAGTPVDRQVAPERVLSECAFEQGQRLRVAVEQPELEPVLDDEWQRRVRVR